MELYGGFASNGGTFYVAVGPKTYSCSSYSASVATDEYQLGLVCSVNIPTGTSDIVITNGAAGNFLAIESFVFTTGSGGGGGTAKKTPIGAIVGGVIGGIVIIGGAVAAFILLRRKNHQAQPQPQNPYATPYQTAATPYQGAPESAPAPLASPMMKEQEPFLQSGAAPSPGLNEVSHMNYQSPVANRFSGAAESYTIHEYK